MKSEESARADFCVATYGSDANAGTREEPFATLQRARDAVREIRSTGEGPITVLVRGGSYHLGEALIFGPEDSGTKDQPITYAAWPGDIPVISGGRKIAGEWQPYRDGIMMCELPEAKEGKLDFTQLFVNGKRQIRARYPNRDPENPRVLGKGYIKAKDGLSSELERERIAQRDLLNPPGAAPKGFIFDPETFTTKKWARPRGAVVHIFASHYWGNQQWEVEDIDWEKSVIWFGHGGFQFGLRFPIAENSRFFVENVFEELDTPGEWYLDKQEGVLYYMPPEDVDLATAEIVAPILKGLVQFRGSQYEPVHHITLSGFRITHTAATFMELYEAPSRGDWHIHRDGAVFLEGAEHCAIENCYFDAVGGNAVFLNNYNRHNRVVDSKFTEAGESAVCLVGSRHVTFGTVMAFPADNLVSNNLIHDCGEFGKQIAGVFLSNAKRTTISHNHIYSMPRAGICFNDSWGGGHIVEFNKIHDTVLETGDHGPFNSWGRERYWCPLQSHGPASHEAGDVKRYAQETSVVRHNYFCEHRVHSLSEWGPYGIDLDDGSSNYYVYGNLCLGNSVSCREGDYRTVENNIFINPVRQPNFHINYEYAHDRFLRNITVLSSRFDRPDLAVRYDRDDTGEDVLTVAPAPRGPWIEESDFNLGFSDAGQFLVGVTPKGQEYRQYTLDEWRAFGFDTHSIFADPMFVDPDNGDYRLKPESPALKLGFKNLDMDSFGLTSDFPEQWRD